MRILLSRILVFLAIGSSARAGLTESPARALVRSSLREAGLEECPDDPTIKLPPIHHKTYSGFPLLEGSWYHRQYEAKLYAAGYIHCLYKLSSNGLKPDPREDKYNGWFLLTRRGKTMINTQTDLTVDDKLLSYDSTGEGQYKWVLVYPDELNNDLRFAPVHELEYWRKISRKHIINAKSTPDEIEKCKEFFKDEVYGKMAKLIRELQYRSMAKIPSKAFFNAVEFNESFKWMKIHPHFVKKTPLTADEIVRWDVEQISKESMHPLVNRDTGEDKAKGVCDPRELFYQSAWW